MIFVYIKKLKESATIPTRANTSDAGYDLYSVEEGLILSGTRKLIKTGISI